MIARDMGSIARGGADVVVVGGGIHGAHVALEAARRGLHVKLFEAKDYGGGASWNSLRIVHGGLRYLQTLDLPRFRQSVRERREIARSYPTLVRPLRCLMPTHGRGLRRLSILRAALAANDALSASRNEGLPPALALPAGEIVSRTATLRRFPNARAPSLEGAASWHDYMMLSSERIVIETLHRACAAGARMANYARVERVIVTGGRVTGVEVVDGETDVRRVVRASLVINCTGSDTPAFLQRQDVRGDDLFEPSLAFNVLLAAEPPSEDALAVSGAEHRAPVLFLVPRGKVLLAGTAHVPRPAGSTASAPTGAELDAFLAAVRDAVPALGVDRSHVLRVFSGLLPVKRAETAQLTKREVVVDHATRGGPRGLASVVGVKFTTARAVAERAIDLEFAGLRSEAVTDTSRGSAGVARTPPDIEATLLDAERFLACADPLAEDIVRHVVDDESVRCVDDLILRRTNWAVSGTPLEPLRQRVAALSSLAVTS